MSLPKGAYRTPEGWIVYGDEAYLPHEWDARQREQEALDLAASGLRPTEIAERLGIKPQTVRNYQTRARRAA